MVFGPCGHILSEAFVSKSLLERWIELSARSRQPALAEPAQLLFYGYLDRLTAVRKHAHIDQAIDLSERFLFQRDRNFSFYSWAFIEV